MRTTCNVVDSLTRKGCPGPHPCPIHTPEAWLESHADRPGEIAAIGPVDGDNDTQEIYLGPLFIDIAALRAQGVTPPVLAQLWTDIVSVYRRWERRELAGPQWAVYRHRDGWLINGGDRDRVAEKPDDQWKFGSSPQAVGLFKLHDTRGLWTHDVELAQRFDNIDEITQWCDELDLFHPEYPRNFERVNLVIMRLK